MFSNLEGEIVCVVTPNGDIVGRLKQSTDTSVIVESPRGFVQTQEGVGFAPSVSLGCAHDLDDVTINMSLVLTVTKAHEEIVKAWRQQTSGLVTP
jgi:hypothetical protein